MSIAGSRKAVLLKELQDCQEVLASGTRGYVVGNVRNGSYVTQGRDPWDYYEARGNIARMLTETDLYRPQLQAIANNKGFTTYTAREWFKIRKQLIEKELQQIKSEEVEVNIGFIRRASMFFKKK